MFNLMYKIIMVKQNVHLTLVELEKDNRNIKVYYGGVFMSRQSLICLCKKVLNLLHELGVFSVVANNYYPDFFQLSYSGLVMSLRYMIEEYLGTLNRDDKTEDFTFICISQNIKVD